MTAVVVRDATQTDLPAISDLYNALISTTTVAWTEEVESLEDRAAWFEERKRAGDPVLVAQEDARVIGFCSFGEFRDNKKWPGYRFTAEITIHVEGEHHGKGVGRALIDELVSRARARGLHVLVAAVDGANAQSVGFHEAMGFRVVARMPEVGWKFGGWLELVFLQRTL
jgi:phosphinothricin acetyltransferase